MKTLSLSDVGKSISLDKGWAEIQLQQHGGHDKIIIMAIKAPSRQVLVVTNYGSTHKKCRAIKEFMRRSRRNGS